MHINWKLDPIHWFRIRFWQQNFISRSSLYAHSPLVSIFLHCSSIELIQVFQLAVRWTVSVLFDCFQPLLTSPRRTTRIIWREIFPFNHSDEVRSIVDWILSSEFIVLLFSFLPLGHFKGASTALWLLKEKKSTANKLDNNWLSLTRMCINLEQWASSCHTRLITWSFDLSSYVHSIPSSHHRALRFPSRLRNTEKNWAIQYD